VPDLTPDITDEVTETLQQSEEQEPVMNSHQQRYYASEACANATAVLENMEKSATYNTDTGVYGRNNLNFVDRHVYYLSMHPEVKLDGYISNLKLMTKRNSPR
jgi:hypothetical protein